MIYIALILTSFFFFVSKTLAKLEGLAYFIKARVLGLNGHSSSSYYSFSFKKCDVSTESMINDDTV